MKHIKHNNSGRRELFDDVPDSHTIKNNATRNKNKHGVIRPNPDARTYISEFAHEYTSMERIAGANGYSWNETKKFITSSILLVVLSIAFVGVAFATYEPPTKFMTVKARY